MWCISSSYSHSSGSYSENHAKSGEYSTDTIYCVGEVDITTQCSETLGRQDEPSLVQYQLKPIFEIDNILEEGNDDISAIAMKNVIENILSSGENKCGNGMGISSINSSAWINNNYLSDWDGKDYGYFWDDSVCFDQYKINITMLNQSIKTNSTYTIQRRIIFVDNIQQYNMKHYIQVMVIMIMMMLLMYHLFLQVFVVMVNLVLDLVKQ